MELLAREAAHEHRPLHPGEGLLEVRRRDDVLQQRERAVLQLHHHALQRLHHDGDWHFEQAEPDPCVGAEGLAAAYERQQAVI